jgi:hypothetical protein
MIVSQRWMCSSSVSLAIVWLSLGFFATVNQVISAVCIEAFENQFWECAWI